MKKKFKAAQRFVSAHQNGLVVLFLVPLTFVLLNHAHITSFRQYFIQEESNRPANTFPEVAIVLGGGIEQGKPKPLLKGRLDKAAELVEKGSVQKLIVSGDNRFENYNEPQVMKDYLTLDKVIKEELITMDMAGRSTYESCERAKKVFGLSKVLLVSDATHLPRAIFICRSFGIEAYGIPSESEASKNLRLSQTWREFLASQKAAFNVYVKGENTILGEEISI